jgi:hypothetical protein
MSPKERAKELVDKFKKNTRAYNETNGWEDSAYDSKQCALIAVDEVIEALHEHHWQNRLIIDYWEEVKHEIEKL